MLGVFEEKMYWFRSISRLEAADGRAQAAGVLLLDEKLILTVQASEFSELLFQGWLHELLRSRSFILLEGMDRLSGDELCRLYSALDFVSDFRTHFRFGLGWMTDVPTAADDVLFGKYAPKVINLNSSDSGPSDLNDRVHGALSSVSESMGRTVYRITERFALWIESRRWTDEGLRNVFRVALQNSKGTELDLAHVQASEQRIELNQFG